MDSRLCFLDCETIGTPTDAVSEMAQRSGKEADRDPERFAALSPWLAEVVCIGVRIVDKAGREDGAAVSGKHVRNEPELLEWSNRLFERSTKLVTYNGRGFDVPLILNRMARHHIQPCPLLIRAAKEPRYRTEVHTDLMDLVTNFGAAKRPSLREVCLGLGMMDPKAGGDGGEVKELYRQRKFDELAAYCLGDVAALEEAYNRYQVAGLVL